MLYKLLKESEQAPERHRGELVALALSAYESHETVKNAREGRQSVEEALEPLLRLYDESGASSALNDPLFVTVAARAKEASKGLLSLSDKYMVGRDVQEINLAETFSLGSGMRRVWPFWVLPIPIALVVGLGMQLLAPGTVGPGNGPLFVALAVSGLLTVMCVLSGLSWHQVGLSARKEIAKEVRARAQYLDAHINPAKTKAAA